VVINKCLIKNNISIIFIVCLFFTKSYGQNCRNLTGKSREFYLAQDVLEEQFSLNDTVIKIDEAQPEYLSQAEEAKNLAQDIKVGLESLPADLDQAIENEKSLIEFANEIVGGQYSLVELASSALDLLEASTEYGSKCMALDLDLEFLEDKIGKECFGQEILSDQIDEFFGYIPSDPFGVKLPFLTGIDVTAITSFFLENGLRMENILL